MHSKRLFFVLLALLLMLAGVGPVALAGSPQLNNLLPVAGQRGQTIDITFYGERLDDATRALFHTPGLTADELRYDDKRRNRVHAKLTIAPDAPLGEHQVRLVTKTGVSEMTTFRVLDRPIVEERRDRPTNNGRGSEQSTSFDNPQPIDKGTTVLGRTELEDVDYFSVELAEGERLSLQVDGMRLGRGFTDSHLAVLGPDRREVASCDDTALLLQDPYLSFVAPKAGRYVIALRDSGYEGGNNNWYLLHVGAFPRPAVVYPMGGRPGETVELRFIGDLAGAFTQQVTLPDRPDDAYEVLPVVDGVAAPSGHLLRVNDLPNVMEDPSVPNDNMNQIKADDVPAHAPPVAFNGVMDRPNDQDYYKLQLNKDQQVSIRVYASALGSPIDTVLNVFSGKDNRHLQGNNDSRAGLDSEIDFRAPHDGVFYIRVRDHLGRHGPAFVYRVEVTEPRPTLSTSITRYDRNRPQSRQAVAVPRGNRFAALVSVDRQRVGGDLTPVIDGLPQGVTIRGLGPAQQGNLMPVVFEAAHEAPIDAKLVNPQAMSAPAGESADAPRTRGGFHQQTPLVMANPNRTEYYHSTLRTLPIAVTDPVPARIEVATPKAPIVHGGRMRLSVAVNRDEGFEGRVRLYPLYRPPGIGATGQVVVNKNDSEGVFTIDANGNVPTRDWPMVIIALVEQPGGGVWVSSPVFDLRVEPPFVAGSIEKSTCEQGEATQVVVKLEHPRDWQGEGELKLLGLPAKASTEPVTIKQGQEQAVFSVKTDPKTPRGNHKSLVCELTIQVHGEPVIHRFGQGGRLRIDRPRDRDTDKQAARATGGE